MKHVNKRTCEKTAITNSFGVTTLYMFSYIWPSCGPHELPAAHLQSAITQWTDAVNDWQLLEYVYIDAKWMSKLSENAIVIQSCTHAHITSTILPVPSILLIFNSHQVHIFIREYLAIANLLVPYMHDGRVLCSSLAAS